MLLLCAPVANAGTARQEETATAQEEPEKAKPAETADDGAEEPAAEGERLIPYTMAWLARYAPASVAPFEEQVGDNGDYEEVTDRPPADTYKLVVDYHNQCVYAFSKDEKGNFINLERVMICTTGGNGNWTPEGTYDMGDTYHRFGFFVNFDCYAQYWTQMHGSFYFHSILYNARSAETYTMSSYNQLGSPGSHGCIRLFVPDARWIFENCAPGTECVVTTEYPKNDTLKNALRKGFEGAIDYVEPEGGEEEEG